jgi:hypothetical protein
LKSLLENNTAVVAGTPASGRVDDSTGLAPYHSYTVMAVRSDADGTYVVLRNPWGFDNGEVRDDRGANLPWYAMGDGTDGYVRVRWDDFKANMGQGICFG